MKFFCEYCGSRIDSEIDDKCPHCGASYKRNKKFIKLMEEKDRQEQLNNEYKQKIINHVFSTFNTSMKFSKIFFIIPIVIFIVIFSIVIFSFINFNKDFDNESNETSNEMQEQVDSIFDKVMDEYNDNTSEKASKEIIVSIDEFGTIDEYQFKVTKYEMISDRFGRAEEGYEIVKFHLLVENLTESQVTKEDINCIVDGIAQTNYYSSGYSDIPMFIQKGLTVKGTATFIVPKNATSYDIRYGDHIIVHIDK